MYQTRWYSSHEKRELGAEMATSSDSVLRGIQEVAVALEDWQNVPHDDHKLAPATPEKNSSRASRQESGRISAEPQDRSQWGGVETSGSALDSAIAELAGGGDLEGRLAARQGARDLEIQETPTKVDLPASPLWLDGSASPCASLAGRPGLQAVRAPGFWDKGSGTPRSGNQQEDGAMAELRSLDRQQALGGSKQSKRASSLSLGRMFPWLKKRAAPQEPGAAGHEEESEGKPAATPEKGNSSKAEMELLEEETVTPMHMSPEKLAPGVDGRRRAALYPKSSSDTSRGVSRMSSACSEVTIASAVAGGSAGNADVGRRESKDQSFAFQAPQPRAQQKGLGDAPEASDIWIPPKVPSSAFAAVVQDVPSEPPAAPRDDNPEWRWTGPVDSALSDALPEGASSESEDNGVTPQWEPPTPVEQSSSASQWSNDVGLPSECPRQPEQPQTGADLKLALLKQLSVGKPASAPQPSKEAVEAPKSPLPLQSTRHSTLSTSPPALLRESPARSFFKEAMAALKAKQPKHGLFSRHSGAGGSHAASLRDVSRRGQSCSTPQTDAGSSRSASLKDASRRGTVGERLLSPRTNVVPGTPTASTPSASNGSPASEELLQQAEQAAQAVEQKDFLRPKRLTSGTPSNRRLLSKSPSLREKRSYSYSSKDSSVRGGSPRMSAAPQEEELAVDSIIKDSLGAALEPVEANFTYPHASQGAEELPLRLKCASDSITADMKATRRVWPFGKRD